MNAATLQPPSHVAGDLLLWFAYNDGSSTVPTIPSGWVTRVSLSISNGSLAIAYRYAASSNESAGTWTNAKNIFATVWRGSAKSLVFPNYISTGSGTSVTISYGAQTANTFQSGATAQSIVSWVANRNATNSLASPSPLTNVLTATDGVIWQTRLDYQAERTSIWPSTTVTVATSASWRTFTLSLVESEVYGSVSGVFNPFEHPLLG